MSNPNEDYNTRGHSYKAEPGETFLNLLTYTPELRTLESAEQTTVNFHLSLPGSSPFFLHDSSSGGDTSIQSYLGQSRPEPAESGADEGLTEAYYSHGTEEAIPLFSALDGITNPPESNTTTCMESTGMKTDILIANNNGSTPPKPSVPHMQHQHQQQNTIYHTDVSTSSVVRVHPKLCHPHQEQRVSTFYTPDISSQNSWDLMFPNNSHTCNPISKHTYATPYCHSPTTVSSSFPSGLDQTTPKHFFTAHAHLFHGSLNNAESNNSLQTNNYCRWNHDLPLGTNFTETNLIPSAPVVPTNYYWVGCPHTSHCCTQCSEFKTTVNRPNGDTSSFMPSFTVPCSQTTQNSHELSAGPWGQTASGTFMNNLHSRPTAGGHRRTSSVKRISRRRCQWVRSRNPLGSRSDEARSTYSGDSFAYPMSMVSCSSDGCRESVFKWDREALARVVPAVSPETAMRLLISDAPLFHSICIVNSKNKTPGFGVSAFGESVQLRLKDAKTWAQLHTFGTEMIATNTGRRVFPSLSIDVAGLRPMETYMFLLDMTLVQPHVFKHQGGQWMISSQAPDPKLSERKNTPNVYVQDDSPKLGAYWMESGVNFTRVKITNNRNHHNPNVIHVYSMHQYAPRFTIFRVTNPTMVRTAAHPENRCTNLYGTTTADMNRNYLELVGSYLIPGTQFYTVTAYQNPEVIRVKIENNPFAKGFRNRQMQHLVMGDVLSVYHHVPSGLVKDQTVVPEHGPVGADVSVATYLDC